MINNTLIDLLKSLNKDELVQFEDFVKSPFFNKKTPVVNLFNYLKEFHPGFSETEKLDRKYIYKVLYPGKPFNYGVMKNLFFGLNRLGEKFLELLRYNDSKPDQFRFILGELTDRKLNKSFRKNLKKAESSLQHRSKDDVYFHSKMDIELLKFYFHIKNAGAAEKPKFDLQSNKYLISYFLIKFFKINSNNLVHKKNFGAIESISFLDEVLNYIGNARDTDPIVLLYYYKFMLQYKEDESIYRKFKKVIKEQIKNLERKEQFNTYINLLNYCYNKIASGEWNYYKELFEIYNEMLSGDIYTIKENDYFNPVFFRLAAETGVKLNKFEWTEQFIKQFSEKLHPKLKDNEINFAFANYYLIKKNYDAAQKHLALVHLNNAYDKVYLYIIQSVLHYETGQFESLISEVDTIRHFISNDKTLGSENRSSFQKYIKYLNELVKINFKEQPDKQFDAKMLKENLVSENGILEKRWLLEKLKELSGKTVQKKIPASVP